MKKQFIGRTSAKPPCYTPKCGVAPASQYSWSRAWTLQRCAPRAAPGPSVGRRGILSRGEARKGTRSGIFGVFVSVIGYNSSLSTSFSDMLLQKHEKPRQKWCLMFCDFLVAIPEPPATARALQTCWCAQTMRERSFAKEIMSMA